MIPPSLRSPRGHPAPPTLPARRARADAVEKVDDRLLLLGPALADDDIDRDTAIAALALTVPLEGEARHRAAGTYDAYRREQRRREQGSALWKLARTQRRP